ncbi:MAG TPA: PfkB family carbohydrate kinase, partial [Planctomycetota bacterium]|nr:PfkB family carbohydrate kinase [Planctomycetota bacterium]
MSTTHLIEALDELGLPRVLIVGDLILDRYITGEVHRISPEAPIPVLAAGQLEERLGGAANVAANLRSMDAEVEVIGVVGDDENGRGLLALMREIGVSTDGCVADPSRPTTVKARMVSGVQQILRVDWEQSRPVRADVERALLDGLEERVRAADAVVLSDYGKGALTEPVLRRVIDASRAARVPVLVDPKGADYARYRGATLLTPNR